MDSETDAENKHLMALLTVLLSAVSQQFIHILLLRKRGDEKLAGRIVEVDDNDFKNAMQILDLLVTRHVPITVEPRVIKPGYSTAEILRAELQMELLLRQTIRSVEVASHEGQARLARAALLRDDYRNWLTFQVDRHGTDSNPEPARDDRSLLFSRLLHLMEQAMIHAFAAWQEGDKAQANTAWQISGAAMLYLTALIRSCGPHFSGAGGISIPGLVFKGTDGQFDADLERVADCARVARQLQRETADATLRGLCKSIAEDCDRIGLAKPGRSIDAELGSSPVFRDFARARLRMKSLERCPEALSHPMLNFWTQRPIYTIVCQ